MSLLRPGAGSDLNFLVFGNVLEPVNSVVSSAGHISSFLSEELHPPLKSLLCEAFPLCIQS